MAIRFSFVNCMSILHDAWEAVSSAIDHVGDPRARGGYFCLMDRGNGRVLSLTLIGEMASDILALQHQQRAVEQAFRLRANPGHVTSWRSREPEKNKLAGAVAVANLILSFSGFDELMNEAVVIALAVKRSLLLPTGAFHIAENHDNPYVGQLLEKITACQPVQPSA
jgi:hypothetical protein